jgi:hypothetical protein
MDEIKPCEWNSSHDIRPDGWKKKWDNDFDENFQFDQIDMDENVQTE